MKILNFGSCNIDYVYSVDHVVQDGETISAVSSEIFPGGKGLNQSISLARAGVLVYHAGIVGEDGQFLLDLMSESGVDTSMILRSKKKNGHAIIQLDKHGENAIFVFKGTNGDITKDYVDTVLSNFSNGDFLLIQNEINDIEYIIDNAYKKGIKVVLNPSPFSEKLKKIDLNKIAYLVLNKVESIGFFGSFETAIISNFIKEKYPSLKVVLTKGVNGCCFISNNKVCYCPAYKVNAVDTTAAGDTFTGYFVALTANGSRPEQALKIASVASALSVSQKGAATSIPDYNKVHKALKTLERYSVGIGQKEELLTFLMEYIEENLQSASVKDFACRKGYSTTYAYNLIKEIAGKPFSILLQEKRCQTAEFLLRETDLPISTIINKVGYENHGFFRKVFLRLYKTTPLEYRKKLRTKEI